MRAGDLRVFVLGMPSADRFGMLQLAADVAVGKVKLRLARRVVDPTRAYEPPLFLVVLSRGGSITFAFASLSRNVLISVHFRPQFVFGVLLSKPNEVLHVKFPALMPPTSPPVCDGPERRSP